MSAPASRTLITARAAAAGLAAIAAVAVLALAAPAAADTPASQASDARIAASALLGGPAGRSAQVRPDADPARSRLSESRPLQAHPFSADSSEAIRAVTAGIDDAQHLRHQQAERPVKRSVKRSVKRRPKRRVRRRAPRRH